jgi:alpha-glucosidase
LVVYQVYPRSFQDSDGDGVGDLNGITARLDHVAALGADAIWLSPIYPSPLADGGYDVADYEAVDPLLGTLADADALIAAAHERALKVLFDVVPCHTSIEHPWFREHPDWYSWSDRDGPQNNWRATFGGSAWSRDPVSGRWYLHSFYPEQPDLNWRNPEVPRAFGRALRFWLDRGVDGFRIDALDRILKDPELRDDPPASGPPPLPEAHMDAALEHRHSRNAPDIGRAIAQLREAAGAAVLVGEVYLLSDRLAPYVEHLDACFSFELLHAPWEADAVRAAIGAATRAGKPAWVLSNHDFARLPDRVGACNVRAAALLLLTLPGTAFVYQGDELGMADGPDEGHDRAGRDRHRHPMPWDGTPTAGFTSGEPWLEVVVPPDGTAEHQAGSPGSMLDWYRALIGVRRQLRGELQLLDADPDVVAFRRGDHVVSLNLGDGERRSPVHGQVVLATPETTPVALPPGGGIVVLD